MSLFITRKEYNKLMEEIKYVYQKILFRKKILLRLQGGKMLEMLIGQLLASLMLGLVFRIGHRSVHSMLAI